MIQILTAHPPDHEWNGLRVSGAEGLEAGLIADFDLPWNMRGTVLRDGPMNAGKRDANQANVRTRILEQIRKRPGMTELELAKFIYGPSAQQPQVNSHCRNLRDQGLVERRGGGGAEEPFMYYPRES